MNKFVAIILLLAFAPASFAQKEKPTKAPIAAAPPSALQAACIEKIRPILKGAERIRDIGSAAGAVEQDIMFAISENGGKTRVIACQVQKNGTLELVDKGHVTKTKG